MAQTDMRMPGGEPERLGSGTMEQYQHIAQAFREAPWRRQLQSAATWLLVLVTLSAVGGLYLASTSHWATTGRQLQALEARRDSLVIENGELRRELSTRQAVGRMAARAVALGYLPATYEQIEYLVVEGYPARNTNAAGAVQPTPPAVTHLPVNRMAYDETLLEWVVRAISGPSLDLE